jgi:hypothetical protein
MVFYVKGNPEPAQVVAVEAGGNPPFYTIKFQKKGGKEIQAEAKHLRKSPTAEDKRLKEEAEAKAEAKAAAAAKAAAGAKAKKEADAKAAAEADKLNEEFETLVKEMSPSKLVTVATVNEKGEDQDEILPHDVRLMIKMGQAGWYEVVIENMGGIKSTAHSDDLTITKQQLSNSEKWMQAAEEILPDLEASKRGQITALQSLGTEKKEELESSVYGGG